MASHVPSIELTHLNQGQNKNTSMAKKASLEEKQELEKELEDELEEEDEEEVLKNNRK
eukprot:m.86811 g.86811  ORF g.86811 m.86811 type:complete len:58 (-) comp8772_c0_seq6:903-1076(-)